MQFYVKLRLIACSLIAMLLVQSRTKYFLELFYDPFEILLSVNMYLVGDEFYSKPPNKFGIPLALLSDDVSAKRYEDRRYLVFAADPTSNPTSLFLSSQPTSQPSHDPSGSPTAGPVSLPTSFPSSVPSHQPSSRPSVSPSRQPTRQPLSQPSHSPSSQPSRQPTCQPSRQPSCQPSSHPSGSPSSRPSMQPSSTPSTSPSMLPSGKPSSHPTMPPSTTPSSIPSDQPSSSPTRQPTGHPTSQPTSRPTSQPSVVPSSRPTQPTSQPTGQPSINPTLSPSAQPTGMPTKLPSERPTGVPSAWPTSPSGQPTGTPSSQPSGSPSMQPSTLPSVQPTGTPSMQPTSVPSAQPAGCPTSHPSSQPSGQPSVEPTCQPTMKPQGAPSTQPTAVPTDQPSVVPSSQPTCQPTGQPTVDPSSQPSVQPTRQPSAQPSVRPTSHPSLQPTEQPSSMPSKQPMVRPTGRPTCQPSSQPIVAPSSQPSCQPSVRPSLQPTSLPSCQPTCYPSNQPTKYPSAQPSEMPSAQPSESPSCYPSGQPTDHPTKQPTGRPTSQPSDIPSMQPSSRPTYQPSAQPSNQPSEEPSVHPSCQPVSHPTVQPSRVPSCQPTGKPSGQPMSRPSSIPTCMPSSQPSSQPTHQPSREPTAQPSHQPSGVPSGAPSSQPTSLPSSQPTVSPSYTPQCGPGRFYNYTEGIPQCFFCDSGMFAPGNTQVCTEAPPGSYAAKGAATATFCPINTYTSTSKQDHCIKCPFAGVAPIGSNSRGMCQSPIISYAAAGVQLAFGLYGLSYLAYGDVKRWAFQLRYKVKRRCQQLSVATCEQVLALKEEMEVVLNPLLEAMVMLVGMIWSFMMQIWSALSVMIILYRSWKNLNPNFDVVLLDRLRLFLSSLNIFGFHIPYVCYVFYPYVQLMIRIADWKLDISGAVTCTAAAACFVIIAVGLVVNSGIMTIGGDTTELWNRSVANTIDEFHGLLLRRQFWTCKFFVLFLRSIVIKMLPDPNRILQFTIGLVNPWDLISLAYSPPCQTPDQVLAQFKLTVVAISILVVIFEMSHYITERFELASGIIFSPIHIQKRLMAGIRSVCKKPLIMKSGAPGEIICTKLKDKPHTITVKLSYCSCFQSGEVCFYSCALDCLECRMCMECYSDKNKLMDYELLVEDTNQHHGTVLHQVDFSKKVNFYLSQDSAKFHHCRAAKSAVDAVQSHPSTDKSLVWCCIQPCLSQDWQRFWHRTSQRLSSASVGGLYIMIPAGFFKSLQSSLPVPKRKPQHKAPSWNQSEKEKAVDEIVFEAEWTHYSHEHFSYKTWVDNIYEELLWKTDQRVDCNNCTERIKGKRFIYTDRNDLNYCIRCRYYDNLILDERSNPNFFVRGVTYGVAATVGFIVSSTGQKVLYRMGCNWCLFGCASIGLWTSAVTQAYDLKRLFKRLEAKDPSLTFKPDGYKRFPAMNRANLQDQKAAFLYSLMATRLIMWQLLPYCTLVSIILSDASFCPLFVLDSNFLSKELPPLWLSWSEAQAIAHDILLDMDVAPQPWSLNMVSLQLVVQRSRLIQCFTVVLVDILCNNVITLQNETTVLILSFILFNIFFVISLTGTFTSLVKIFNSCCGVKSGEDDSAENDVEDVESNSSDSSSDGTVDSYEYTDVDEHENKEVANLTKDPRLQQDPEDPVLSIAKDVLDLSERVYSNDGSVLEMVNPYRASLKQYNTCRLQTPTVLKIQTTEDNVDDDSLATHSILGSQEGGLYAALTLDNIAFSHSDDLMIERSGILSAVEVADGQVYDDTNASVNDAVSSNRLSSGQDGSYTSAGSVYTTVIGTTFDEETDTAEAQEPMTYLSADESEGIGRETTSAWFHKIEKQRIQILNNELNEIMVRSVVHQIGRCLENSKMFKRLQQKEDDDTDDKDDKDEDAKHALNQIGSSVLQNVIEWRDRQRQLRADEINLLEGRGLVRQAVNDAEKVMRIRNQTVSHLKDCLLGLSIRRLVLPVLKVQLDSDT